MENSKFHFFQLSTINSQLSTNSMIVYLKPQSPFSSIPRSDTLFGAIASAIRVLFGEQKLSELLQFFDQCVDEQVATPFTLSSIFPAVDNVLFFPRPVKLCEPIEPFKDRRGHRVYKKLLRTQYVSASVLEHMVKGEFDENTILNGNSNGASYRIHAGAIMTKKDFEAVRYIENLMTSNKAVRYGVNEIGGGSVIYDSLISASNQVSFYFLMRVNEEKFPGLSNSLKTVLRYMGDIGFGGGKSIGRGHCEVEFAEDELPFENIQNKGGGHLLSLSLLYPNANDKKHFSKHSQQISGHIVKRKGIINPESGVGVKWKPTLTMLSEGSIFPRDGNRNVYGTLYRLGNIRINGLGYIVPIA